MFFKFLVLFDEQKLSIFNAVKFDILFCSYAFVIA